MINVLIISERFAPENTVAAVRMTKVAKYIKQQYKSSITVITRKKEYIDDVMLEDLNYIDNFIYIEEGSGTQWLKQKYTEYSGGNKYKEVRRREIQEINDMKKINGLTSNMRILLRSFIAILWSEFTARSYLSAAKKNMISIKDTDFNIVLSSFGPESSHYLGRHLKNMNPKVFWIADYRDPLYSGEATKGLLALWAKSFPMRVTKRADAITVASKGFINCLGLDKHRNVNVITNGYDDDEISFSEVNRKQNNRKMVFAYVGSLLTARRDIVPILNAIKELVAEGSIAKDKILLQYAGGDTDEFRIQTGKVGLDVETVIDGWISKRDSLELQHNSDVLLMAAWNTEQYTGSLPLKLYEYMTMKKPIICSVSGTNGDSEVKSIINACGIGYCYEEVNGTQDFIELKDYLLNCYNAFCEDRVFGLELRCDKEILSYSYRNKANQFINLYSKSL